MIVRLKQFLKDGVVYGIGGIAGRAIAVILLPVYARIFDPSDYGTIEMLAVLGAFFGAIMAMGLDSAQAYFFFEQRQGGVEAQGRVVSSILQWRLLAGSFLVLLATGLTPVLNRVFFDGRLTWHYFAVVFVSFWITQIGSQNAELFRLSYRPWPYLSLTLLNTVLSVSAGIFFVVGVRLGVMGALLGTLTGALVTVVIGCWAIRRFLDFKRLHTEWWPRLLKFGMPLIPAALAMYALHSMDRWFILYFVGRDALGLFAVGAKFALLIAIAVTTFRQAWWPVALDAIHSADGLPFLRVSARLYLGAGCAGVVVLTALSPWLVSVVTTTAYYEGYPVVGILAWQSIFYGFFMIAASGLWKAESTGWISAGMVMAVLVNLTLDIWWIPRYGIVGAAAATAVAFFAWNVFTIITSERAWPVRYPFGTLGLQVAAGVSGTAAILLLYRENHPVWHVVLVTTAAVAIIAMLTVRRKEAAAVAELLRMHLAREARATQ